MKLKNISRLLSLGLLFNSFNLSSFASVLSEDGRYETFTGNNISINDILEKNKVDIKIEGNTLVNHANYYDISYTKNNTTIDLDTKEVLFETVDINTNAETTDSCLYFKTNLKVGETYTLIVNVLENTMSEVEMFKLLDSWEDYVSSENYLLNQGQTGLIKAKFTVKENNNGLFKLYLRHYNNHEEKGIVKIKDLMILEGDWTNKDIPEYFEGIKSGFEDNLVTQEMVDSGEEKGENLGKYKVEIKSTGKNILPNVTWELGEIRGSTGEIFKSDSNIVTKEYIPINSGSEFTLKFENELFDNPLGKVIAYYDKDKNFLFVENTNNLRKVPDNARYIRIRTRKQVSSVITEEELSRLGNVQLEYGLIATDYEPYKESINTFYLNSPLLEGDTIECINGQPTHIKRYKKIVLDGSESWSDWNTEVNVKTVRFRIDTYDGRSNGVALSDKFRTRKAPSEKHSDTEYIGLIGSGSNLFINILSSKLQSADIDGFKQWLSKNHVTVVYELEEPVYEPIKADLSVQLFEGTTHISNNSNIPINIEITVDRTLNRAVEAIELAKINPTIDNLSKARMWTNLVKESLKKDELQEEINTITNIKGLELEKKSITANVDIYIKSENSLSMTLSTNSIMFEDYSGVSDIEKLNALEVTVNSSLPYDLNAYLESEIQNNDKSTTIDSNLLQIKESKDLNYKAFTNTIDKIILEEDCPSGNYNKHNIDLKMEGTNAYKADIYKTVIKFEVEQK